MEELVAKRYINAIRGLTDLETFEKIATLFFGLSNSFNDAKFLDIISNPSVKKSDKATLLLDSVKVAESKMVDNLLLLLVEKNRVNVIPAIAEGMRKIIAADKKLYSGTVYSDSDIDESTLQSISAGLSKRVDANVDLNFVKSDFNGIKVDVEDLGLEVNLSKDRINSELINHILKAI